MNECRLCRSSLHAAARMMIDPAPSGAQHFATTPDEALGRATTLSIVECRTCGLVQSASAPVEGYRRAITAAGVSAPMREHRLAQARRLRQHGGLTSASARIALIGCGNGYELPILAEAGFRPEGIEWGGAPSGYGGEWPIHDGYPLAGSALPAAPYEGFACYNFLEHAPGPRGFLEGIADNLVAGGVGIVEVPNYARQCAEQRVADFVADHLTYFDAATFRAMLTLSGFEILELSEVRDGENLEAIVRRRADSVLPANATLLAKMRRTIHAFFVTWHSKETPAVAWGASHQALTLFAGSEAPGQPRAILDSAPFKRGMFAPASGIPVVAPSSEAIAGAGAVLIIASGYETEIARALRTDLEFRGEVWTVRGAELHRLD